MTAPDPRRMSRPEPPSIAGLVEYVNIVRSVNDYIAQRGNDYPGGNNLTALAALHWAEQAIAEVARLTAEVERLAAALKVCGFVLHRVEPTDAELHAGQQASGAAWTDWTPDLIAEDGLDSAVVYRTEGADR